MQVQLPQGVSFLASWSTYWQHWGSFYVSCNHCPWPTETEICSKEGLVECYENWAWMEWKRKN